MAGTVTYGLGKSDYRRMLSGAMRALIDKRTKELENVREEMVFKVNIEESLHQLRYCPACGSDLVGEGQQQRSCECGHFVVTDVWSDGTVVFGFTLLPEVQGVVETPAVPDEAG